MALTLRVKAGQATFSIADGPMKAEWTLTTSMSEEELVSALVGMLRYVRAQPQLAEVIPLRPVPDAPADALANQRAENAARENAVMSWKPAVAPRPLDDSLMAAEANGFELIPPEEMGD